jgi:RNA polymerase sigma factor (sigma-70 family)
VTVATWDSTEGTGLTPALAGGPVSEASALRAVLSEAVPDSEVVSSEATGVSPGEWDWTALNNILRPKLIGLAVRKYNFSREQAEDAVQTVYMRVLARDPRVKDPIGYVKVAFLNTCLNIAMAKERCVQQIPEGMDVADPHCEKVTARLESVRMVNQAIRSAGPKCKRIVRLYFGQEYSLADMTKATGYSKKTVWKRIWGCLERMRKVLA